MGDPGPSESGALETGDQRRGGGLPRGVGVSVSALDAVLLVAGLMIWTALFVLFFAQR